MDNDGVKNMRRANALSSTAFEDTGSTMSICFLVDFFFPEYVVVKRIHVFFFFYAPTQRTC